MVRRRLLKTQAQFTYWSCFNSTESGSHSSSHPESQWWGLTNIYECGETGTYWAWETTPTQPQWLLNRNWIDDAHLLDWTRLLIDYPSDIRLFQCGDGLCWGHRRRSRWRVYGAGMPAAQYLSGDRAMSSYMPCGSATQWTRSNIVRGFAAHCVEFNLALRKAVNHGARCPSDVRWQRRPTILPCRWSASAKAGSSRELLHWTHIWRGLGACSALPA